MDRTRLSRALIGDSLRRARPQQARTGPGTARRVTFLCSGVRAWRLSVAAVLLAVTVVGIGDTRASAPALGFVAASGKNLVLDGRLWRPIGYNQYRLTSIPGGFVCDSGYGAISDASLAQRLDQMKASGANAVRSWFFQRYWEEGPAANKWAAFDRFLAAAAARQMKVIPVLVNHWTDCEWPSIDKNHWFYQSGYLTAGYGNQLSFKDWAVMVATRYAAHNEVAFWQLVNEAEASFRDSQGVLQCPSDAHLVLRNFVDDMVGRLKAVDTNHLVSLGTIGSGQCGASADQYRHVHAGAVDICEYHEYADPPRSLPGDQFNGVAVRLSQCDGLNKPIFVGEAGIRADVAPDGTGTGEITAATLARRASFSDAKMASQFAEGLDGWLFWESIAEASTSAHNSNSGLFGIGPSDPIEAFMRGWTISAGATVGSIWYSDGSTQRAGSSETSISLFGTGLAPNTAYRLVHGVAGAGGDPCHSPVPVNLTVRISNSRGFIPITSGVVNRPSGAWQVCFRSTDGARTSPPAVFTVT